MILTLETAMVENGVYTWRFPAMTFSRCIQNYEVGIPISYDFMYDQTLHQVSTLIKPPMFHSYTFDFETDYFTVYFVSDPTRPMETLLVPTELSIELIPVPQN